MVRDVSTKIRGRPQDIAFQLGSLQNKESSASCNFVIDSTFLWTSCTSKRPIAFQKYFDISKQLIWSIRIIRVRKRPFHFSSIFNNLKKMKIDSGLFSIQFLIFRIMKKTENRFF